MQYVDAAPPALPDLRFKFVGAFPAYTSTELAGGADAGAGGVTETSTAAVVTGRDHR